MAVPPTPRSVVGPRKLVVTMPPVPKVVSRAPADGTQRSSSTSSRGRNRGGFRLPAADGRFRFQAKNHMMRLLSRSGPQYDEKAIAAGAQTERLGLAGPVRDLFGARPQRPPLRKRRTD